VSVSFTDEDLSQSVDEFGNEYIVDRSPVGLVYIPAHSVDIDEDAAIRYERHPWIEAFELDGIRPAQVCCIWQPGAAAADAVEQTSDKIKEEMVEDGQK
jgi:hypothetical protein